MFNNITEDARAQIARHFPERQLYVRSGGEVSYHTIGTKTQLGAVSGIAMVTLWCLYTGFNALWGANPLLSPSKQAQIQVAEYERKLKDAEARVELAQVQLAQQQDNFERATRSFEEKHTALAQLVNQPIMVDETSGLFLASTARKGEVLMSPVEQDIVPRQARNKTLSKADMNTGTALDNPINVLDKSQNNLLLAAASSTQDRIDFNRAVIDAIPFTINEIYSAANSGTGGPLDTTEDMALDDNSESDPRLGNLKARAMEAQKLDTLMTTIPLGYPVQADNYKTSRFGMRRDPFTKRPAMHSAVDIASFHKAPIVATADGKVSFSGRKGAYGNVVEIDHGYGFKTRYAHLAKTYVKRGQDVVKGEKLGGMGSTGRSTSTHLHYEIHFQGRKTDPDVFLKAGRYVQQN